jgi:ATP-binding cassette, subfamily B, bacterial
MHRPKPSKLKGLRELERQGGGYDIIGDNITFSYSQRDEGGKVDLDTFSKTKTVLNDLSFHFECGKLHAIVGDNGSGKTTLIHVLTQLYEDYIGVITVNGHDIKSYNIDDVRQNMTVMFQDVAKLINFSVLENIGMGDISLLTANPKAIEAVAAESKITDFIGLDTIIGDLYEQNKDPDEKWQEDLSGGQWQKIALARVFLRAKDADLMILDEPTSALDVDAECQFFQQLKCLRRGKTTIFITHKYTTTWTADCIHFMQGGRIVERGTHEELLAMKGEYARRYTLQTQGYAVDEN